ncbi:hypothetical protein VRK_25600 [Vibrio sp. MEBiC08052]|nr:hypothetical protein VRK_25600 [Vibrio sp. MEBiC08052]
MKHRFIFNSNKHSKHHIFLYLYTIEITVMFIFAQNLSFL